MTRANPETLTIPALFRAAVKARGDQAALGAIEGGRLAWRSWNELAAQVAGLRQRLLARSVAPGDRVVQVSSNCADWIVADLAIQTAGAVHVPLHSTLAVPQIREQIAHSGARLALVRERTLAAELRAGGGLKARIEMVGELMAGASPSGPGGRRTPRGTSE